MYRSKLEKHAEKYDTRFGKLMRNGETFDPMLNRYDAILRYLARKLPIDLGMKPSYSFKYMVRTGMKLCNSAIEGYTLSKEARRVYRVSEWEVLFDTMLNSEFTFYRRVPGKRSEDNRPVMEEFRTNLLVLKDDGTMAINPEVVHTPWGNGIENLKITTHSYNPDSGVRESISESIMDVFNAVEKDLAYASYGNIKDWEPGKFNKNPYPGSRVLSLKEKALVCLSVLSFSGYSLDDVISLLNSKEVESVISSMEVFSSKSFERNDSYMDIIDGIKNSPRIKPELQDLVIYLVLKVRAAYARFYKNDTGLWHTDFNNPYETGEGYKNEISAQTSFFSKSEQEEFENTSMFDSRYDNKLEKDQELNSKHKNSSESGVINELEKQLAEVKAKGIKVQSELYRIKDENDALKSEIDWLTKQRNKKASECNDLKKEVEALKEEVRIWKDRATEYQFKEN